MGLVGDVHTNYKTCRDRIHAGCFTLAGDLRGKAIKAKNGHGVLRHKAHTYRRARLTAWQKIPEGVPKGDILYPEKGPVFHQEGVKRVKVPAVDHSPGRGVFIG